MIKIQAPDSSDMCAPWITPGKVYEANLWSKHFPEGDGIIYTFIGDRGETNHTTLKNSLHLNGNDWRVVE